MTAAEIRELLELAAKAGSVAIDPSRYDHGFGFAIRGTATWWNPLSDDGDSRRLEVALKINVEHYPGDVCALGFGEPFSEKYGDNQCAAARLAVLRAAASIGRVMS